jgi:hypothetical protein
MRAAGDECSLEPADFCWLVEEFCVLKSHDGIFILAQIQCPDVPLCKKSCAESLGTLYCCRQTVLKCFTRGLWKLFEQLERCVAQATLIFLKRFILLQDENPERAALRCSLESTGGIWAMLCTDTIGPP